MNNSYAVDPLALLEMTRFRYRRWGSRRDAILARVATIIESTGRDMDLPRFYSRLMSVHGMGYFRLDGFPTDRWIDQVVDAAVDEIDGLEEAEIIE